MVHTSQLLLLRWRWKIFDKPCRPFHKFWGNCTLTPTTLNSVRSHNYYRISDSEMLSLRWLSGTIAYNSTLSWTYIGLHLYITGDQLERLLVLESEFGALSGSSPALDAVIDFLTTVRSTISARWMFQSDKLWIVFTVTIINISTNTLWIVVVSLNAVFTGYLWQFMPTAQLKC